MAAYTTIDDPSAHFQVAAYTGNGGTLAVTNDGGSDLQPDLIWIKSRSSVGTEHHLMDSTRGFGSGNENTPNSSSNSTEAEYSRDIFSSTGITSDGFSLDPYSDTNTNTATYVAWQWKANSGTRTTNAESGNNPGGGYQANTTGGFSVIDYVGTGGAGTMAHGLGAVPHLMLVKSRDGAYDWAVYHHKLTSAPETDRLLLNTTGATDDSDAEWNDTAPTSSVFTIGTGNSPNRDGDDYIAYLWSEKQGYSKFGGYTGNGAAEGAFVYTGFRPAYLLVKRFNTTGEWGVFDHKRNTFNVATAQLKVNATEVEEVNGAVDFCAYGFKLRETSVFMNGDGDTYVYVAFAEAPFVNSNGVPGNAR